MSKLVSQMSIWCSKLYLETSRSPETSLTSKAAVVVPKIVPRSPASEGSSVTLTSSTAIPIELPVSAWPTLEPAVIATVTPAEPVLNGPLLDLERGLEGRTSPRQVDTGSDSLRQRPVSSHRLVTIVNFIGIILVRIGSCHGSVSWMVGHVVARTNWWWFV